MSVVVRLDTARSGHTNKYLNESQKIEHDDVDASSTRIYIYIYIYTPIYTHMPTICIYIIIYIYIY